MDITERPAETLFSEDDLERLARNLSEKQVLAVRGVLQNWPLRSFPRAIGMSGSAGNKEIRKACAQLGLKSREQLLFLIGYLRVLDLDAIR